MHQQGQLPSGKKGAGIFGANIPKYVGERACTRQEQITPSRKPSHFSRPPSGRAQLKQPLSGILGP
jgi:hypothetical protein